MRAMLSSSPTRPSNSSGEEEISHTVFIRQIRPSIPNLQQGSDVKVCEKKDITYVTCAKSISNGYITGRSKDR